MISIIIKNDVIGLFRNGESKSNIARKLNLSRRTVIKYLKEYKSLETALAGASSENISIIQEKMFNSPKYDSSKRKKSIVTDDVIKIIDGCFVENDSRRQMGIKKQLYDCKGIHQKLLDLGYRISYSSVTNTCRARSNFFKECFIRQEYNYGETAEFDYGEVKLNINGKLDTYYIAVISIPKINYRWAYLYNSSKQQTMFDAHIRFFKHIGGIHLIFVYDNMRNIVSKFIGINEKEINLDAKKFANYYGFNIRLTNCRKGNEKGHVEGSVDFIRNRSFTSKYHFDSLEDANEYLQSKLVQLNKEKSNKDEIQKEVDAIKKFTLPDFDYSIIQYSKVNSYGCISIDSNFYSVPEYLIGSNVKTRIYLNHISIFINDNQVASHKKLLGMKEYSIKLEHYLNTFLTKPGALHNSSAIKQLNGALAELYQLYYTDFPKLFIELLLLIRKYGELTTISKLKDYLKKSTQLPATNLLENLITSSQVKIDVESHSAHQLNSYDIFL